VPNSVYPWLFADGEQRTVAVRNGVSATWTPALASGAIRSASSDLTLSPPGTTSNSPPDILTQRFDLKAPVYITEQQRLANRGAILTADVSLSAATLSVDSTDSFPQAGNFMISTGTEDMLVNVANATTLNIVARAQDGTAARAVSGTDATLYQLLQVDFQNGGSQAFYVAGALNSGIHYLGMAATVGALKEYLPEQPLCLNFTFDGSYFEMLTSGNLAMFVIADGVVMNAPNSLVEQPYGGIYWHKFDFGSRKTRHLTLFLSAYPMAIAYPATDSMAPWDRAEDVIMSFDGDSFGQTEGYSWQNTPDGGGLGFSLEMMLALGISEFDYMSPVGGTGYSQQGSADPPAFPRPKYSGAHRVAAITAGPAPTLFVCALGHNDNGIARPQFAADTLSYWKALRAAWPQTVFVAVQYFFPAAGPAAPLAFQPNPLSTPNDTYILAALKAIGGPWVVVDTNQGTWQNSSGASGSFGSAGQPLLTGTGYGGAPGYAGGHSTGVGNGDLMIRDDGVHPSNLGARYLGQMTAAAIAAGVLSL
jgi:hypothetical protein